MFSTNRTLQIIWLTFALVSGVHVFHPAVLIENYCYMKKKWNRCIMKASEEQCQRMLKEEECDYIQISESECTKYIYYFRDRKRELKVFDRYIKRLNVVCGEVVISNLTDYIK
jgi:hypothetical protein